jgi:hypothetical protein
MIGDLVVDARLAFNKLGAPPLQIFDLGDLNVKLNVVGNDCIIATAASAAADNTLPTGRITSYGYVMLKNMYPGLIATPGMPTVTTSGGGATRYEYRIVATQTDGAYTAASPAGIVTNGPAALGGAGWNYITWDPVPDATQGYGVYRTVGTGGAHGLGLIATVPGNAASLAVVDQGTNANGVQPALTSPWDFTVQIGPSNTVYPILLKGGDVQVFRWNFAASPLIHYKMLYSPTLFAYMLVED